VSDILIGLQPLLLDVLLVIMPVFIYQFILDKTPFHRSDRPQRQIAWLCIPTALLCMSSPFALTPGHFYDLRALPIYIAILYGGYRIGILGALLVIGYRYHLGGPGFFVALTCICSAGVVCLALCKRYPQYSWHKKRNIASGVVLVESVFRIASTRVLDGNAPRYLEFTALVSVISIVTMVLVVYLIESIGESVKMRLELARSDKLQVVSDLAASIAHEIRNPMTTARGFAQLFLEDSSIQQKHGVRLSLMVHELDRAQEIITDYLSFARPQAESMEVIDVNVLLRNVISLMSPYAAIKSVSVQSELSTDCPAVCGNQAKLRQALVNVVKNSIEATPDGGMVQVTTRVHQKRVEIRICDTGVGMTPAEVVRLGSPFYSTKSTGTGLGLMVTYQIIGTMNGNIRVNSTKGAGTTFCIGIPEIQS
jgi:two-component system, sporulation sensor kinase B